MKRKNYLLLIILFSIMPFFAKATHIVGGTLTYTHLGGSSYRVTLKLYRDCGGVALPNNVTINVVSPNGDSFDPSRDINIPLTSKSFVPAFVDTCVIQPNVCVQEGIYTAVVNNLPGGGYHLYYSLCCRNASLANVNSPLTTGASFFTDIPSLSNIYYEDFTLPNNTTSDVGVTAWTRTLGAPGPTAYAKVNNNLFEASKTNGQVVWTSQVINIAGKPSVNLSLDFIESGNLGATDTIQAFYKINGGPQVLFATNGRFINDFGSATATTTGLVGNTVQIIVKMNNHNANLYQLDNVLVWDNSITNSSPAFSSFPPIFVCQGNPLVFDNSAIDINGDSLVYSLYRPYTDANPTFPGNVATFTGITYNAGYGITNPMGGAAGSVSISPTGIITTTPSTIGQYVVGVKVKEYRNGVFLNEVTRDFQFNVLNCPPPGKASFAAAQVCSGKALTFNNTSPASLVNFAWNFGDAASGGSNTSLIKNPTHTFSAVGSYNVRLISNPGSACADTAFRTITVSSITAAYALPATNCMGQSVSFADASTVTGPTTVTGWLWSFGDGSTSAIKTPTHTYAAAATYSIKLVATNGFGCKDSITKSLVINPIAVVNPGGPLTVCANSPAIALSGIVTNATGGTWSSPTAGAFSPGASTLINTYTLTNADTTAHTVTLTLTSTGNNIGCPVVTATKVLTINRTPIVSAGPNKTVCANNRAAAITGSVLNAGGATPLWTTNGSGTFFPNANTLVMTYNPSDADTTAHNITLTLTVPAANGCAAVSKTMALTIVPKPSANFTAPVTVCANKANINLVGTVTQAAGGTWTSTGSGAFSPSVNALTATYTPSAADKTAGTVTLTLSTTGMVSNCLAVPVSKTISITPAPTSTPGPDQSICSNNSVVTLTGAVTNATGGLWTGGTGSFGGGGAASLNATYLPSPTDLSVGSVTLTLITTGMGTCNAVATPMTITFTPSPTVSAGSPPPTQVCANNPAIILNGSFTIATGAVWSGGTGAFTPNTTTMNATYTPSATEIAAGVANLSITTTGNNNCNAVVNNIAVAITPSPTVTIGLPVSVCANKAAVNLTATLTVATGVAWTSNGTGIFSAITATTATYTPSATDITNGTVTITATTNAGNGTCNAVAATKVITITPAATVSIASVNTVCANNAAISLTGSITAPATGAIWTSNGTGTFNNGSLTPVFTPSVADKTAGSVIFTLTTTGSSPSCVEVSTTKTVTITPAPTVAVGPTVSVCANNATVNITATLTVATGVQWTTNGTGTFGNSTALSTTYIPSAADKAATTVTLTATTNAGNGTCNPVAATKVINITVAPTVSIASLNTVCANNAVISLTGSITAPATGGNWTSNGTGIFANASALVTTYTPSAADKTAGSVILTLTTTGSSPSCVEVNTTKTVTITPAPTVNQGPDQSVCANNALVSLSASETVATGVTWSTNGSGTFSNNNILNPIYTPSAADKAAAGPIVLTILTTGNGNCTAVTGTLALTITPSPTADAGPVSKTVCSNNPAVAIAGTVTVATGGTWTTSGGGTFTPSANALTATYNPGAGDLIVGIVNLFLTSTGNGTCLAAKDTLKVVIFNAPVISGLNPQSICKNNAASVSLTPAVSNSPTTTLWTTNGTGTFANANAITTTYSPSVADVTSGAVTLTLTANKNSGAAVCNAVSGSMVVTFTTSPTVNAGGDQTVCANNAATTLAGSMTVASASLWTTNGTGTFANATALSTTYTPSPADTVLHSVILTLTTTSQGNCAPVSDAMTLTISPKPTSIPGIPQTVCANNASVTLGGSVRVATGGIWSSAGTGTFSPNVNTLNATYLPSLADKTAGTVTLTLATTGNGNCVAVSQPLAITITPAPTANAGVDRSICANNPTLTLGGSVTVATGGTWTGGTGVFSNPNSLTSTYTASAAEIAATTVTLTLVTTGMGTCNAVQDQMIITVTPGPTVNAGSDQVICSTSPNAPLNGSVTVATGGTWTSNGTGSFAPNANTLTASYVPSAGDKLAGNITLTLTTTGIGNCIAEVDQMVITITANPTSSAGPNQTVCTNDYPVLLAGVGAPSVWQGGTGTFTPSRNVLNASYTPSAADSIAGSVILTLQPNLVPGCTPAATSVTITIPVGPVVNAGPNVTVCGDVNSIALAASVTHAAGGTWTSNGTGTFSPNANTILASYIPSAADKTAGSITITLTSTGSAPCTPESDQMILTITPVPTISAGPDLIRCADVASVPVTGTKNAVVGNITWTRVGGGGTFSNSTALSMNYTPSVADTTAHSVKLVITSGGTGTCATVRDTMMISFTPAPVVNAGAAQTVCADTAFIILNGSVSAAATGGTWTGGAGGVYSPNNTTLHTSYFPTAADTSAGFINFTLTTTGQGTCNAVSKVVTVTINHAPVVNAGPDKIVCADIAGVLLNGASVLNAGGGTWTSTGTGSFAPNPNTVLATYNFSAADKTGGTVTLTLKSTGNGSCKVKSDQVILTVTTAPTVSAGPSRTICADANTVPLTGSVTVATGGTWTSAGTGSFSPNANTLIATYNVSAADKIAGPITLTLTTTGNGTCIPVTSTMTITITPAPIANAGAAQTICADAAGATLNGIVTTATGGNWTSNGTGTFSPNAATLNASYVPSVAERATVANIIRTLTLTTTGNGTCNAVTSTMLLTITPSPTVSAGASVSVCGNNALVALSGSETVATGGLWTSNGTGTFANANALNTTYTPSASDVSNGSVDLILTTVGNGTCNAVTSTKVVSITPAPVVAAGANRTVCANNPTVALNGSISAPATGGTWTSTTGAGTFSPNAITLNATYTPSAAEILSGTATLQLASTGNGNCNVVISTLTVTITPSPTSNPGAPQSVCANNATVALNGIVTVASGGNWTSTGTGTFTPNASTLIATYTPSAADTTAHGVTLTLTTSGNGTCNSVSATKVITITPAPVIKAGSDQTVCADLASVTINGSRTVATGSTWSTSGSGTFANAANLNTTYTPSATDKTNGTVTLTLTPSAFGTCGLVTDQMIVNITPAPTVDAGSDQTICADLNNISLTGTKTVATGVIWSTTNGTGIFSPSTTSLNAFYTPSLADKTSGPITIKLTTTGNGTCNAVSSQFLLTITPAPTVSANVDQTVCADIAGVSLNGSNTVAGGVSWTSTGTGTFAPNNTTLNAVYTPSAAEITAGQANLTITTTANGTCNAVSDQMKITITPAPTVNAGPDLNMCADGSNVVVNGSVTIATGGTWSTASGTGTFTPNANTLLMSFTPSALQITQGFARLTLTTTGNGTCIAVSDQMQVNIAPLPIVNPGPNQTVCADVVNVPLSGVVTNAAGGTWTSNGTGTFSPNANTLNASYVPSAADKIAGTITLTLTSTGNGLCNAYSKFMTLRITPAPTVDAGPANMCADVSGVQLNGTLTVATGGLWTTTGTGTFSPSANVLNPIYTPSGADLIAGSVKLKLTTTGNGTCLAVKDSINLGVGPPPTANAGPNQVVCSTTTGVILSGAVTVSAGGIWSTPGTGTFSPNVTTLNATYMPSPADITAGSVVITLTTTGNGLCRSVSSQMTISITPGPTIKAGPNQTICADAAFAQLNGIITVSTGGLWSSSGTGIFTPTTSTLNAKYIPSAADTTAHNVMLRLVSTGNGLCAALKDSLTLTITPAPTVNAGADQTLCSDLSFVALNGKVTTATGGTWSTIGGSGSFLPNANSLTASYTPSAADTAAHSVRLVLVTSGNGTCNAVRDTIKINLNPRPVVNAGPAACSNNPTIPLSGSVFNATGGKWTTSGSGIFTPDNISLVTTYTPSAADVLSGKVFLQLESTGNGVCDVRTDSVTIDFTSAPTANAGLNDTVCANNGAVTLSGAVTNAAGGTWSTNGSGTFLPNVNTLNATYQPSAADTNAHSVRIILTTTGNGTCLPATDTMFIKITPAPTVNPGPANICSNNPIVNLNGAVSLPATGGQWSTSGTGTFGNNTNLSTTYTFSPADNLLPVLFLTLTSTGNGTCNAVSGVITVNIAPPPTVSAGPDQVICSNNNLVLNGTVTVAGGGAWSNGTGTFSPNASTIDVTYIPSAADILTGGATLILTTTGNGACNAVSDTMNVVINPAPSVNAGPSTVCSNNATVALSGTATNATGGTWTRSGTGVFTGGANNLITTYTPSGADNISGSVVLTLTTTGMNPGCSSVSDNITLTITNAPLANAGPDHTICADSNNLALNGIITVAASGTWTTSGTGTFTPAAPNNPVTTYHPSAADTTAHSLKLYLTTTGNGTCLPNVDSLTLTITPAPTVQAGADQTICADRKTVNVSGAVTVAAGSVWKTTGTGTFANANALSTIYTLSNADTTSGSIKLYLESTGNGTCKIVRDSLTLKITHAPTVNSGPSVICNDATGVQLNGNVTVATGGFWSSGGDGIFSPNPTTLAAIYVAGPADKLAGSVMLKLTTTGNGTCNAIADSSFLKITPQPTATGGADQGICTNSGTVTLNGSVTIATGGIWSTLVNTGGTYVPGATSLSTNYNLTSADTAAHLVKFILTTTGNGGCLPATDTVNIDLTPAPLAIVNAGVNQIICADQDSVILNGHIQNAAGGAWVTSGNGIFTPNPFALNANYIPDAVDKLSGVPIQLILASTGNGVCNPKRDTMLVFITPIPTSNPGANQTICADAGSVALNGIVTAATGGTWATSGSGSFTPNANTLVASYHPSVADIADSTIILTLTTSGGCTPISANKTIFIRPAITVNSGSDQIVCADNLSVPVNVTLTVASSGTWSTSGTGIFANANNLSTTYAPSNADTTAGSVRLRFTSNVVGSCLAVTDSLLLTITKGVIVNAGPPQTICADASGVTLAGKVLVASGGIWTSTGTGAFFPNDITLNGTYVPSAADTAAHAVITLTLTSTGNGTCNPATSTMALTITPAPTINAGPDQTVCKDVVNIALSGSTTVATGGNWTTSGSGTFAPLGSLVTTYTPTLADKAAGQVTLTLTSTGMFPCNAVQDQMKIIFTPAPTSNAGPDMQICADAVSIGINGSLTVATGGTWSILTGTGTIANANNLSTAYAPSAADTTSGLVQLILTTSVGNGTCNPVKDTMSVSFTSAPTVDAGLSQIICADAAGVTLIGTETTATGGVWASTGSGVFTPNPDVLSSNYSPSSADKTSGLVTLYLTTTGNGGCNAVRDSVKVTITPLPTVNAGPDQSVCGNNAIANLAGSRTIATATVWTTSGSGIFGNTANLATTYTPSVADITSGAVTLTLTSTAQGTCNPVFDKMLLIITSSPVSNPGSAQSVCANNAAVKLNGSVTISTGGLWSSTGTGTFSPNDSTLVTTYIPSAADTTAGSVRLKLTTTGNSNCNAVKDSILVTITKAPTSFITAIAPVCADINSVTLNGIVTVATGGTWTTSGTGVFALNTSDLTGSYFPSAADKAAGTVGLTLTTTGNGSCLSAVASRSFTITKKPVVNAGIDKTICADAASVFITGTVTPAGGLAGPGTGTWTTSGTGIFNPNANTLAMNYVPSAADIAGGTVDLTLTSTSNGGCIAVSDLMAIVITKAPTANSGPDKTICADASSLTLNGTVTVATGGTWTTSGTGSFTPNANVLNAVYHASAADTIAHSVTLTLTTTGNGTCNAVSDPVTLAISPLPIVNTGAGSVCADVSGFQLNGTVLHAGGGQWSSSGTGVFSPNAFVLAPSYTPSLADIATGSVVLSLASTGNGTCNIVTSSASLTITPLPVSDAGPDESICRGTGTGILAKNQNANNSYKWFTTAGVLISNTFFANVTANSDTLFVLMATDQKGCSTRDTVEIFAIDPPIFNLTNHSCLVNGLVLNSNPNPVAPPNGTFQWFENNNTMLGENNPSALPVGTVGTYIIEYKFGLCSAYDTTIVSLPPQLYSPDTITCLGQVLTIKTTNVAGATYVWTTTAPALINGASNTFSISVTATPVANDSTNFIAAVTDNVGCISHDTIEVKTVPLPILTLPTDTSACAGDTIVLVGKPSNITNVLSKYTWFKNGLNLNVADSVSQISVATNGKYKLIYGIGGCSAKDSSNVVINPNPVLNVADIIFCFDNGSTTDLNAGAGFNSYHWYSLAAPDSLASHPDNANQMFKVYGAGRYYLSVTNTFGCKTNGSILATSICRPDLNPPTGFYPDPNLNPDNCPPSEPRCKDLYFRPFGNFKHSKNVQFTVFNRWGEIIFYTDDPSQGWDGKYRGALMESGTYPWTLYYEGLNEEFKGPYKKSGSVTIIK